jgi:membrane-bound ClpP family serine protease
MTPERAAELAVRIRADYALSRSAGEAIKQAIINACAEQRQEYADLMDEAAVNVSDWGAYASEYFQDKWDLAGYVKKWQDRAAAIREEK